MKRQIEMPVVVECSAAHCAYNQENHCYAKAITVGGRAHPACDTFVSDDEPDIPAHRQSTATFAGVGACKTIMCRHNRDLECGSPSIRVEPHASHADCATFESVV
jgi:hypothetical protein